MSYMDSQTINGEMITIARESRELTQSDLEKKTGISQAEISRYENRARQPSHEHLELIADKLDYQPEFFCNVGRRYGLGSSGLYHRRRVTGISAKVLNRLAAQINVTRLLVEKLLSNVTIDHPQIFSNHPNDQENIEYIAERVRAEWNLPGGPITDLVGAIEDAGGIVHRTDFKTTAADAFAMYVTPVPPIFLVNRAISTDRLRFTLAHEIGHLVLHQLPTEDPDNIESDADKFASAFLMPQKDIRSHFSPRLTLAQLVDLKRYWRVSMAALARRARDIDCITDRHYRSLMQEMSAFGYRKNEPVTLPPELPTLLDEIILAHQQSLGYTIKDIASLIGLQPREFDREYISHSSHLRLV